MKAIVIGRHAAEIPGIEVEEVRAVTWPARSAECATVLQALVAEALQQDNRVLLQNTPGQVTAAIAGLVGFYGPSASPCVGVIVSVPGPRPGKVTGVFMTNDPHAEIGAAVRFANPRAEVTWISDFGVEVTVDGPPMPFEFSHIEWLY